VAIDMKPKLFGQLIMATVLLSSLTGCLAAVVGGVMGPLLKATIEGEERREANWRRAYMSWSPERLCKTLSGVNTDFIFKNFSPSGRDSRVNLMLAVIYEREIVCPPTKDDTEQIRQGRQSVLTKIERRKEAAAEAERERLSAIPDADLCRAAALTDGSGWKTSSAYQSEVLEAKRRGLTFRWCDTISGRASARLAAEEEQKRQAEAARREAEEKQKRLEAARLEAEERRREELSKPRELSSGSGFVINKSGHLLTNRHVVERCEFVTIHPPSGPTLARVVASDPVNDLALLKTDMPEDDYLPISANNASLLDNVIVAGYPLGPKLSSSVKVTTGVVSSLTGLGDNYSLLQIDAAVQKGSSGGPILNDQGNVIAVTVSGLDKLQVLGQNGFIPENINFGIKSSTVRAFVEANGVSLPQPHSMTIARSVMAGNIVKATHLVRCWVSNALYRKMKKDRK